MRALVDMDGVLVDLVPAWLKVRGFAMPEIWPEGVYDLTKIFDIHHTQVWEGCDETWWAELPFTSDAQQILEITGRYVEEIYLVTNPVTTAGATGKIMWIAKNLPGYLNKFMLGPCRHLLANKETILIDDQSDNVDRFCKSGGQGILLARHWNRNFSKSNQTLADLESRLSRVDRVNAI